LEGTNEATCSYFILIGLARNILAAFAEMHLFEEPGAALIRANLAYAASDLCGRPQDASPLQLREP
jgi:hypothetical protein